MALVIDPALPYGLTVTLVDVGLNTTDKTFDLQGADFDEALTNAAALLTDLIAVTKLKVKGYSVNQRFVEDAFIAPTDTGAEKENNAVISVRLTASPLKTATVVIPAPVDAIMASAPGTRGYNVVNTTAALLVAYLANFSATSSAAYLSDGEMMAVGGQEEGHRTHRKSRRG